jgi:hypothetical protein
MFPVIIMSMVHVAQITVMYAHKLCICRSNGKVVYSMLWLGSCLSHIDPNSILGWDCGVMPFGSAYGKILNVQDSGI